MSTCPEIFEEADVVAQKLDSGTQAPSFVLPNQDGEMIALQNFRGTKAILYFYPAASTPGCTSQACDFRDNLGVFQKAGYVVLGISKDELQALQNFAHEERLDFPLLSDVDLAVHHAYGAFGEKSMYGKTVMGVIRSTFVVDEKGVLEHALYNVKATGHVEMLRKKLNIAQ